MIFPNRFISLISFRLLFCGETTEGMELLGKLAPALGLTPAFYVCKTKEEGNTGYSIKSSLICGLLFIKYRLG